MLEKYAATLERRGVDSCSSQIIAEVLEKFPKSMTVRQLSHRTGKSERYIKRKIKDMKKEHIPIELKRGSKSNYVSTTLFEPVRWILKEKENADKYIFIGDRTKPGGNDYPLAQLMDTISDCDWYHTKGWEHTKQILEKLSD